MLISSQETPPKAASTSVQHLDEPELAGGVVGAQRLAGVPLLLLLLLRHAGAVLNTSTGAEEVYTSTYPGKDVLLQGNGAAKMRGDPVGRRQWAVAAVAAPAVKFGWPSACGHVPPTLPQEA